MTETIDFKLTLDAAGANRALDDTRRRAEALGGAKESLGKQLTGMKEKLEKSAGAFAALSLAMGNNNDVGSKVLSSVGQLAAAYGAGGPLAVALAAGAAGVSMLTKHWDDLIKKQDEALASTYAASDKILARSQSITNELRRLTGADQGDQATAIKSDIATAETQRQMAAMRMGQLTGPARDAEYEAIDRLNKTIAAMQADLKKLEKIQELSKPKGGGGGTSAPSATGAVSFRLAYDDYNSPEDIAAAYEDPAELERLAQQRMDIYAMEVQFRVDEKQREHQATVAMMEEESADRQRQATQYADLATTMASALGSAAATAAFSQEEAFKLFVSAASQAAGGFITLEGGKKLAEGIGYLSNPLTAALAPHTIAIGAGLIAAGAAVTTGGPMAVQQLMGQAGAGSSGGGGSNIEAARTSGVGGSRGGGRGSNYGGGGTNITIVYGGASGPTADQGADAVVRGLVRAQRRGMTPVEVR